MELQDSEPSRPRVPNCRRVFLVIHRNGNDQVEVIAKRETLLQRRKCSIQDGDPK
jgi:hypothetical protein